MGRKLALLIGTVKYDDPALRRLEKVAADVEDFASVLRDPAIGAFDRVDQIVDSPFAAVYSRIAEFFVNADREDLLVLYFSGHGLLDDFDEPYLAVRDTSSNLLSGTGIPRSHITAQMDRSRSRQQVLILDCCYSGNLAAGRKGSIPAAGAFRGRGNGRVILAASRDNELAKQSDASIPDSRNSVYTHFVVHGLRTGAADIDGNGFVTVNELHSYLCSEAARHSLKQAPKRWAEEDQGEIVLAANPNPSAQLPPELKSDLDSGEDAKLMGAILKLERLLQSGDRVQQRAARMNLERLTRHQNRIVSDLALRILEPEKRVQPPEVRVLNPVPAPHPHSSRTMALATAVIAVLILAVWGAYQYFGDTHGLYSTAFIPRWTVQILDPAMVRKVGAELRGHSNRPYVFDDIKGACTYIDVKPGDLITFDKLCYCPNCKVK